MLGQQAGAAILNILKNKAQDVIELVIIDTEFKNKKINTAIAKEF